MFDQIMRSDSKISSPISFFKSDQIATCDLVVLVACDTARLGDRLLAIACPSRESFHRGRHFPLGSQICSRFSSPLLSSPLGALSSRRILPRGHPILLFFPLDLSSDSWITTDFLP